MILYNPTNGTTSGTNKYPYQVFQKLNDWRSTVLKNSDPSGTTTTSLRPLANNVVALLLVPALSTNPVPPASAAAPSPTPYPNLAPGYVYDSEATTVSSASPSPAPSPTAITYATDSRNRLPPVIRVVLYTIDEASARRLNTSSSTMPNLYQTLSTQTPPSTALFQDPTKLYPAADGSDAGDLSRFETVLQASHLTFHRYEEAVETIPGPWSLVPNQ